MPKTIKLSNMGEQALKLHMKAKKHNKMQKQSNVFLDQQRKQMTTMKYLLFICRKKS